MLADAVPVLLAVQDQILVGNGAYLLRTLHGRTPDLGEPVLQRRRQLLLPVVAAGIHGADEAKVCRRRHHLRSRKMFHKIRETKLILLNQAFQFYI